MCFKNSQVHIWVLRKMISDFDFLVHTSTWLHFRNGIFVAWQEEWKGWGCNQNRTMWKHCSVKASGWNPLRNDASSTQTWPPFMFVWICKRSRSEPEKSTVRQKRLRDRERRSNECRFNSILRRTGNEKHSVVPSANNSACHLWEYEYLTVLN